MYSCAGQGSPRLRSSEIRKVKTMHDPSSHWKRICYAVAALSFGAAILHAWVAPEHFREWWGYGTFFWVVALAQGLYAIALLGRFRYWLLPAGIAMNLLFIAIYVVTRTAGIPLLGPHAGEVEPVASIDVVSKLMELGLVVALFPLLWRMSPAGVASRT
jgi:hypothetical protein